MSDQQNSFYPQRLGIGQTQGTQAYFTNTNLQDAKDETDTSRAALYFKKHNKPVVNDSQSAWQYESDRNKVKLALIVLLYLFENDEEGLTQKELKVINKYRKKESSVLTEEDAKSIHELSQESMTLDTIKAFLKDNNLGYELFDNASWEIHNLIKKNMRHIKTILQLREEITAHFKKN